MSQHISLYLTVSKEQEQVNSHLFSNKLKQVSTCPDLFAFLFLIKNSAIWAHTSLTYFNLCQESCLRKVSDIKSAIAESTGLRLYWTDDSNLGMAPTLRSCEHKSLSFIRFLQTQNSGKLSGPSRTWLFFSENNNKTKSYELWSAKEFVYILEEQSCLIYS